MAKKHVASSDEEGSVEVLSFGSPAPKGKGKKPAAPKAMAKTTAKKSPVAKKRAAPKKKKADSDEEDDNDEEDDDDDEMKSDKDEDEDEQPVKKKKLTAKELKELQEGLKTVADKPDEARLKKNFKKVAPKDRTGNVVFDDEDGEESEEEEKPKSRKKASKPRAKGKGTRADEALDFSLPPMTNIETIFEDLTAGFADKLAKLFKKLDRPLRIATMCSGTEAPILALRLMFRELEKQTGVKAQMHHVFSAEIEPYKQAYIERNFAPPILFRDVTELMNKQARTAYGAMVDVPGDVDILVAGTSCVDYSSLNRVKKDISDGGESGRTFYGMLEWVKKNRPAIVILENVVKAPWKDVCRAFNDIQYSAQDIRLDTKKFYIPHTRTRGYLVAFPKNDKPTKKKKFFKQKSSETSHLSAAEELAERWADRVVAAQRPASAPTEAFLLDADDPRVHLAREQLSHVTLNKDGNKRAGPDWVKCEQRHALARHHERLGQKRPLTDWQDGGGKPTMPDGAWQDWAEAQTERVVDLMDISYLRQAQLGVDITYKSAIWNLSQNVDRTTASKLYGVTPCLTPNMIPYLTNRGGPVVGNEALALQGLPIDELLLTRETTDQLANLAGNAMSSTVVGTAIAAALAIAGHTLLDREYPDLNVEMADDGPVANEDLEARFRGSDRLVDHPVDLASVKPTPSDLLERAHRSARKCTCEGRDGFAKDGIVTCSCCGYSSCKAHAGKPEHKYVADPMEREAPAKFEADLKEYLPMRLTVPGFERVELEKAVEAAREKGAKLDNGVVGRYVDIVSEALEDTEGRLPFHFRHIDRRETWRAVYAAEKARLELHFEKTGMAWRLFVTPPKELNILDPLRCQLEHPVARIKLDAKSTDVLGGSWQVKLPLAESLKAEVEMEYNSEEYAPSWRASLELEDFLEEKRPAAIIVKFKGDSNLLDRPIDGIYQLETKCGTASSSLYHRTEPAEATPLYFFLDPSPYLQDTHDSFVFAETCTRTENVRDLVASMKPGWRLPTSAVEGGKDEHAEPSIVLTEVWTPLEGSKMAPGGTNVGEASHFSTIKTGFELAVSDEMCSLAEDLLRASVPLAQSPSDVWATENWHEVDLQHEGAEVFSKLAWLTARIPEWDNLSAWQSVEGSSISEHTCNRCAPVMPDAQFIRRLTIQSLGKPTAKWIAKISACEDGLESANYEKLLKNRPSALVVHTRQQGKEFEFRVGLNIVSLVHRAFAQLPDTVGSLHERSAPTVEWRLTTSSNVELGREKGRQFTLKSNRNDPEAKNPALFVKYKLRKEQLRSLNWMIAQEENPKPWVEEEMAEAVLPQLGWHAQAKATRETYIRGGVIADAVGYGKTAITLGLLAARLEEDAELPDEDDRIPIKATLVVVPSHLSKQWPSEVAKFTKPALKTLLIQNLGHLKKATIDDFRNANIVVVADTVFKSQLFWPHLADFSGSHRDIKNDKKAGRYFRHTVDLALDALGKQVKRLETKGAKAVYKNILKARDTRNEDFQEEYIQPNRKQASDKAKKEAKPVKLPKKPDPSSYGRTKAQQVNDKDWNLDSSKVINDYNAMKSPPLTMFSFARVVVDEFSYTEGCALAGVHACRGRSRWILSGTPPLDDFSHVKFIASMLHVHLGTDDDNEGTHAAVRVRADERTKAEEFRSYCDVRTKAWHKRRDDVAQRFLDQFARQNIAEIDEIPFDEEIVGVRLPGAEMAIYRELEHHLFAVDPNLGKLAKIKRDQQGDRDRRLREALGQSKTPEEALLKRCSHFSLDLPEDKLKNGEAVDVCDFIHKLRERQLKDCADQIKKHIAMVAYKHRKAVALGFYHERPDDSMMFKEWVEALWEKGFGDDEADARLRGLTRIAGCENGKILGSEHVVSLPQRYQVEAFNKQYDEKEPWDEYVAKRTYMIRSDCANLRQLHKELIGRYRSKRYFNAVRNVLRPELKDYKTNDDHAILSCCGHEGPFDQIQEAAKLNKCIDPSCKAIVFSHNIIRGDLLGSNRPSGHFGYKLETLITLIDATPEEDRVLVFVQFEDLFDKVHEALMSYDIPVITLKGTATAKAKSLEAFQNPNAKKQKVLLLLATDSSSSGANLTVANHAFFVSPLLTDTRSKYKALSTQATGRIIRYGQQKHAHIVHLLVHGTLDIETYAEHNYGVPKYQAVDKIAEVMSKQKVQRLDIENPKRDKLAEWVPVARKKKAAPKPKPKKEEPVAEEDENDSGSVVDDEPDAGPKRRKAVPVKGANKKKSDRLTVIDSDEEEDEAEESEEDESDEEESAQETDEDEAMRGDEDDYEARSIGSSPPVARANRPKRASTANALPKYTVDLDKDDSDIEIVEDNYDDEDEEDEVESRVSPSPPTKKRSRRVVDSEDEEEEEPVASPSRSAKAASSFSAVKKPVNKGKGKASDSPAAKRRKSVFELVIPVKKSSKKSPKKSPKKTVQARLSFGKKDVPPAPSATESAVSRETSVSVTTPPVDTPATELEGLEMDVDKQ
ncbi:hypothetical protein JCM8547_006937 [Rhodosporidiobolus lusitaniae]